MGRGYWNYLIVLHSFINDFGVVNIYKWFTLKCLSVATIVLQLFKYLGARFNQILVRLTFFSWIPRSLSTTTYKWMKSANDASLPRSSNFFKVLCCLNFKLAQLFSAFPKALLIMLSCCKKYTHSKEKIYCVQISHSSNTIFNLNCVKEHTM